MEGVTGNGASYCGGDMGEEEEKWGDIGDRGRAGAGKGRRTLIFTRIRRHSGDIGDRGRGEKHSYQEILPRYSGHSQTI